MGRGISGLRGGWVNGISLDLELIENGNQLSEDIPVFHCRLLIKCPK